MQNYTAEITIIYGWPGQGHLKWTANANLFFQLFDQGL
jgi:hypothetical protein